MAEYRSISLSETDPESPLTTSLAQAWTNNCTAIAEGADGAPRIDISKSAINGGLIEAYNSEKITPAPDVVVFEADISNRGVIFDYSFEAHGPMTEKDLKLSYQVSDDDGATWSAILNPSEPTITSPFNADDARHTFFRSQVALGVKGAAGSKILWLNEERSGMIRTDTAGNAVIGNIQVGYTLSIIPNRVRWLFTGTESITEQFTLTATTPNLL